MTDQPTCPKCWADDCGSNHAHESRRCLRNQLAAVTKERDDLLSYRTANKIRIRELNGLLGNEVAENTRLLGLLGEIEVEINKAPPLVSFDYIAHTCKRIKPSDEGSK